MSGPSSWLVGKCRPYGLSGGEVFWGPGYEDVREGIGGL